MRNRQWLPLLVGNLLLLLFSGANAQTNAGANDADGDVVRFNFRFGFFEDELTPNTDIMKDDVEGVLCQTQYFLSQLVQNATNSKSVHAMATEIDWGYYEGQELPAHVNFTIEYSDAAIEGDVNWVDDRILINEMEKIGNAGLQKFITDWVWKAEPAGLNFFTNANRMAFDGVKQGPVRGQLAEAACPATDAPTIAPTSSLAPTMAENTNPDTNGTNPEGGPNGQGPNGEGPNGQGPNGEGPNGQGPNGQGPNGGGPNGGLGGDRSDWPFGPNYGSLEDLQPMADFSLAFSMFENHEQAPTDPEVNALLCQVNEYFTAELRRKLLDGTIHMKAVYIDYSFDEAGRGSALEDIRVNFTAFCYYGADEHDQVAVQDVFEAMKLTNVELKNMVENYVWKTEPEQENVFFHTESMGLNAGVGQQINTNAMLVEAEGCVLPPNDDGSAFAGVPGPSDNNPGVAGANGGAGGDPNLGLGGDAKQTQITVNFRVSNLENIKEEIAVKASGLDSSFPVFTNELVGEVTQRDAALRTRLLRKDGRALRVVAIPGTSEVTEVNEYPCPESALPDLTCHSARAKYDVLMSSDEDEAQVQNTYTDASETAVNDGTYNNVLQRVDPDTPLYIGIMTSKDQIPPGSAKRGYDGEGNDDDGGWPWWVYLLIVLAILLCCLCCLLFFMLNQKKDEPVHKETIIEEREILVEEFDDEDAPQDRGIPQDGEDDEEFVDDPAAQGAMVPFDADKKPAPEEGVMVPVDDKKKVLRQEKVAKAHDDQAARERILGESQRGEEQAKKEQGDDQKWEEDV